MLAGAESVAEFAEINELRHLRFAHDQLRAAFDLVILVGETERDGVARVVGPFDHVDRLSAEEVH